MKFSSRDDIEAPIDFVFAQVSDFASLERSALRRGAEVQRVDDLTSAGPGMQWQASFQFRGKTRHTTIELAEYDPPTWMAFNSLSNAIKGRLDVELVALSRTRTRLALKVSLTPRNLSARLLVQSMKLARSSLNKKFDARLRDYARDIEERYHRTA